MKNKAAVKASLMAALKLAVEAAYKTGDDSEVNQLVTVLRKLGR